MNNNTDIFICGKNKKRNCNNEYRGHYFRKSRPCIVAFLFLCFFLCVGTFTLKADAANTDITEAEETETAQGTNTSDGVTSVVKLENKQFDVKLSYGIDGYAVQDSPIPVSVDITSSSNFEGSIALTMMYDDNSLYNKEFVQDISLAADTKNTVNMTLYLGGTYYVRLQIKDSRGNVVYEEQDSLDLDFAGNRIVVGILSDDYNGLNYFDGLMVTLNSFSGITATLSMDEKNFPADVESLNIVNYIIIDNFDTSKLDERQYEALKAWVRNGGILICALGSNYQSVLHCFNDSFITGTTGNMSDKDIAFANQISIPKVACMDFMLDGGTELDDISSDGTAYMRNMGRGAVMALAYSLCMEPIAGADERSSIAELILSNPSISVIAENFLDRQMGNSYYPFRYENFTERYYKDLNKNKVKYLIIFVMYGLFVGPVLYFVLKKKNKREYMWLGIPVISLIFTGIVLVMGNSSKIKKPIVSTFSISELGNDSIYENITADIICPQSKEYTVDFDKDIYAVRPDVMNYYMYGYQDEKSIIKINNSSDKTQVQFDNKSIFEQTSFKMNRVKENNIGQIDADIKIYTDGFEGTVTNNTNLDFKTLVIVESHNYVIVKDIKSGETVNITPEMIMTGTDYGMTYFSLYYSGNYNYDINNDTYYESEVNEYVYEAIRPSYGNAHAYIWALTDYSVKVTDADETIPVGESVIYTEIQGKYEDIEGFYSSDISEFIEMTDGGIDIGGNEYNVVEREAVVEYVFPQSISELRNVTNIINNQNNNSYYYNEYAEVYAYNVNTQEYDRIFEDQNTLTKKELENYIKDNHMVLRFTGDYSTIPVISAKGE